MKNYLIIDKSNNILAETKCKKEAFILKNKHKQNKIYWHYN